MKLNLKTLLMNWTYCIDGSKGKEVITRRGAVVIFLVGFDFRLGRGGGEFVCCWGGGGGK